MKVVIAVVGKPRDRHLAAAISAYEERARHYFALEIAEVREVNARGLSAAQVREQEGTRLLERVPAAAALYALDERGSRLASPEFAALIGSARDGARDIAFAVGGAFGLSDAVRSRAVRSLQLAPFTLPHELARLVLSEQVYRAGTILKGEPYHK